MNCALVNNVVNGGGSYGTGSGADGDHAPGYSAFGRPGKAAASAICNWGTTTLTNCTVANGNCSGGYTMRPMMPPGSQRAGCGGGIVMYGEATTLKNCLFGGNRGCPGAYQSGWAEIYGSVVDGGHNLMEQSAYFTNAFALQLSGDIGRVCEIHTSSNLTSWFWLATVTNQTGQIQYTDPQTTNYPLRFYRAAQLP
jgi:hypothetical protein